MNTKTTLLVGAIAAAVFALPANAEEIKKGGTLTYTFQPEPPALSTVATTAVPVAIASTKIFESLLEYSGPELEPKPGLAESWSVSPDQTSYTFKLRPGVTWQDGTPFTSEDVKFSVERILLPYHARGKTYFGQVRHRRHARSADGGIQAEEGGSVLPEGLPAHGSADVPELISSRATDLTKFRQSDFMQHPIGTGPFALKEWKKGKLHHS